MLHREMFAELGKHGYGLFLAAQPQLRFENKAVFAPRASLDWHEIVRQCYQLVLGTPYYVLIWGKRNGRVVGPWLFVSCKPITTQTLVSDPDLYDVGLFSPISEVYKYHRSSPDMNLLEYLRGMFDVHPEPTFEVFISSNHLHIGAHVGRIATESDLWNWNAFNKISNIYKRLALLSVARRSCDQTS